MPGLPQPLRCPTKGRNHPSAHGYGRQVPLPHPNSPSSQFLPRAGELTYSCSTCNPLRMYEHGSHAGEHMHALASLAVATCGWRAHPSAHGHLRLVPCIWRPSGSPITRHSQNTIHTPAALLQRCRCWPSGTATSPPIAGCQHPRVSSFQSNKGQSQTGAKQTSHLSSKSALLLSSKWPREGDNNPGSV